MLIWNNQTLKLLSAKDIYERLRNCTRKIMNDFVLPAQNVDRQGIETEANENQYWLDN